METREYEYRGYGLIDFSDENWIMPPRVLVFDAYNNETPVYRADNLAEAKDWIDRIIKAEEFNEKFEDFIND